MTPLEVGAAIAFMTGAGMAVFFGRMVLDGFRSRSWPTVRGEVVDSRVLAGLHWDPPTRKLFSPMILYKYHVEGRDYIGYRVTWGDYQSSNRRSAEGRTREYPVGGEVTVFYRPGRPQDAILAPGIPMLAVLFMDVGLTFMILAALGFWLKVR